MAGGSVPISTPSDGALQRVLVVGEPLHAGLVAARLARALRAHGVRVQVLETDTADAPGVACFDPDIHAFHRSLGMDAEGCLRHLRSALRYGVRFQDWSAAGATGRVGFGDAGQPIDRIPFQHYVTALRESRPSARLADYCPAIAAADARRFALKGSGPLGGLEAGLSVDRGDYLGLLRAYAGDHGVERIAGSVGEVERDADGSPRRVWLDDGRTLDADLYFDCSDDAVLAGPAAAGERHPWPLAVDVARRASRREAQGGTTPLCDEVAWQADGWERRRFLPGVVDVERIWIAGPGDSADAPAPRGLRRAPWRGRCIALGGALGAGVDWVADRWLPTRRAVGHWLRLLPGRQPEPKLQDEFNRIVVTEALRIADAQCLPLAVAARRVPGWSATVHEDATAAADLHERSALYRACGRLAFHEDDPLPAARWMMLLEAMDVLPQSADALLPARDPAELERRMDQVQRAIRREVDALPDHAAILAQLRAHREAAP